MTDQQSTITLPDAEFDAFVEALDNPPAPTPALVRLMSAAARKAVVDALAAKDAEIELRDSEIERVRALLAEAEREAYRLRVAVRPSSTAAHRKS